MSINKDSKKVPNIRFKGFTDDWEQRKLGDMLESTYQGINTAGDKVEYSEKGVQVLQSKHITSGEISFKDARLISKDIYPEYFPKYVPIVGDILFANIGTIGPSTVVTTDKEFLVAWNILKMTPKDIRSSKFIQLLLQKLNSKHFFDKVTTGNATKFVNKDAMLGVDLTVPSIYEQSKISEVFVHLDYIIALHQRKLDQLRQLKEAFLQQMFPGKGETVPKLRFAGFEGDWEERKLGDTLVELKSGLSRMLSNNDIGLPVIRANNIKNGMLDLEADIKYWYSDDPQGANTENYLVEKENILINFINSDTKMGTAAIVREATSRNTIYTTNILKAQTNSDFNSYFWFTLTQTLQYKNSIKMITKPAVNQSSFTTVDFKKLIFAFPKLSEQSKIGKLFKDLDNYIVLQSQKVNKLKLTKELLLQNMFI